MAEEKKPAGEKARGRVVACCLSERKGVRKHEVDEMELVVGKGIEGDAHAGRWHRH